MADTRKDRRAPVPLKVRFRSASIDDFVERYSEDISRGGIFIKSKKPLAIGTLLKFELQLEDQSRVIRGVGRVVWSRDVAQAEQQAGTSAGMGIKFIKMDAQSREFVQRIVEKRDEAPGTFDQGVAAAGKKDGFFPDSGPAELPPPEDRTTVRHASEFLASALAGGDQEAAKEAEANAEAARKRTEEIQREREAAAKAKTEAEAPASPPDLSEPDDDDEATVMAEGMAGIAAAADAAVVASAEGGAAGVAVDEEDATVMVEGNAAPSESAEAEKAEEPKAEKPAAKAEKPAAKAEKPAAKAEKPAAKAEKPAAKAEKPAAEKLAAPPTAAEPKRSLGLPFVLGLAAIAVVGYLVYSNGSQPTEPVEPIAQPTPEPIAQPTPEPIAQPTPEPVVDPAVAVADAGTELVVETVSVALESTPPGAEVRVAGEMLGVTPVTVTLPADVPARITLKAPGYVEASREITPTEGVTESFDLEALPFVLAVRTIPAGARVSAGGQVIASAPGELRYPLLTRSVLVVVTKRGYARNTLTVEASSFEETDGAMRRSVEITLEQQASSGASSMRPSMMAAPVMTEQPTMTAPVMTEQPTMTAPTMAAPPVMTEPPTMAAPTMAAPPVMTEPPTMAAPPVMAAPTMAAPPTMAPTDIPDNPF